MPTRWLGHKDRNPCGYKSFGICDIVPSAVPDEDGKDALAKVVLSDRMDPAFLAALAEKLKWPTIQTLILSTLNPGLDRVRRGDFGESLAAAHMSDDHGYEVPVRKLRFKMTGNQTQPGTDLIALLRDASGRIAEVCYVESKLRTIADKNVALTGATQLLADYRSRLPEALFFVAARLFETNSRLFQPFRDYLADRSKENTIDTFALFLVIEASVWDESLLDVLEEDAISLPRLSVHAARVPALRALTDEIYARVGITEISDDD